ncbi:MAG: transposase [Lachnospiraceae bacterium]|nr:transposase [Lachnospiraceae bacterium]
MCYAALKLWNICNYERLHYKELELEQYPDWYYQKKFYKDNLWFKSLPSQTAQEICKLLDKSWKSFYALRKSGGVENSNPPRFKHESIPITYMQNAIVHENGSDTIRLSLPKQLKGYMSECFDIHENYLYLKNRLFQNINIIKQIKIYPPVNNECKIIIVYEVSDVELLPNNDRYLSIDFGVHNLMTCLNSVTGESFIIGRKYLSLCHYYNKEIARIQSQWSNTQYSHGIKHPKSSKHIRRLYIRKNNVINDYLHKITRYIASYCKANNIHTVIIGDITGIRKDNNHGVVNNQNLHALPYKKILIMFKYKLAMEGISLIMQKEAYSSQCSPLSPEVSKRYTKKSQRIKRGLYVDGDYSWNADCVGAYNILRLYLKTIKQPVFLSPYEIKTSVVIKVAA